MNLAEVHEELRMAAIEMQTNGDDHAGILRLSAALELVLRYLEERDK